MTTDASAPAVTRLDLKAPLTGVLVPIEQVPDPVFAQKMVGEGISIDPLSDRLLAPCDGEVIHLHPASHAVTIRTLGDLEVLLHIGLDTVKMRGEGFDAKVKVGDQVRTGDELISFDLDKVATSAKSLLTQVVIANSNLLTSFTPRAGLVTAGADDVAEVTFGGGERTARRRRHRHRRPHRDLRRGHHPEPDGPARRPGGRPVQSRAEVRERHPAQTGRRAGEREKRHGDHGHGGAQGRQGPGHRARPGAAQAATELVEALR